MTRFFLLLVATMAFTGNAAVAQTMLEDTDGDGAYSYEEMLAAYPDLTQELFDEADANADGAIDADELAAAREGGLFPA
ncbi:EF-hand domain-containing protein [Roseibacterium beibuensis]|uniref:EF-hand domain-containing protein n=1 Tax=[Roseibacterium] beibuensis TaxID=1193142 RepID=A0ABP9L006_9RHOB|nr:EF-hand domain-containing protein [Roseibacterium beibuensis]MCS6621899.1 EF-hand domain-containing protein [Roseibacterium beibuensis]